MQINDAGVASGHVVSLIDSKTHCNALSHCDVAIALRTVNFRHLIDYDTRGYPTHLGITSPTLSGLSSVGVDPLTKIFWFNGGTSEFERSKECFKFNVNCDALRDKLSRDIVNRCSVVFERFAVQVRAVGETHAHSSQEVTQLLMQTNSTRLRNVQVALNSTNYISPQISPNRTAAGPNCEKFV